MELSWIPHGIWNLSPVSIAIALATAVAVVIYNYLQMKDLPPGPTGLPFLGYWPFLDRANAQFQLTDLKKKYGDIFSFYASGRLYINLGSSRAIREAHITNSDCFTVRPMGFTLFNLIFGEGVGFINGEQWKVLRKFFLQVLKERGTGALKDSMSRSFYDAINSTIDELKAKKEDEPVDLIGLFATKCNTLLQVTLFSKDDGISQEEIEDINENYGVVVERMTLANMLLNGNIARYFIFPFIPGYRDTYKKLKSIHSAIYKVINDHKATYSEERMRDMIDDYIRERNERQSKGDPTTKHFTDKALMYTLIQFIGESGVSIPAFIVLFIKVLLEHPEEQEKIYKELVEVVGVDRQPTMEDKSKLTYTNAFLQEAQRTTDFFPFFPTLQCTKETTVSGYRIPKDTITLMNIYSAHNDPETYENPEKFDPSRFIVTEGKRRPEQPITFGMGKRSCIGEGLTMMQAFIFVTSLVKNFRLKMSSEEATGNTFDQLFSGKLKVTLLPRK